MNELKRGTLYVTRNTKNSIIVFFIFTISLISILSVFNMAAFTKRAMQLIPQEFNECHESIDTLLKVLNLSKPAVGIIIIVIISIILLFRLDVRKKEIGIYISLGKTKMQIFTQFLCEMMIIVAASLPVAAGIGFYTGNLIAKKMVLDALKLTMNEMSLNLGDKLVAKQGMLINSAKELNMYFDPIILMQAIAIVLAGVIVSIMLMNLRLRKLQAREILSKSE